MDDLGRQLGCLFSLLLWTIGALTVVVVTLVVLILTGVL